MSKKLIGLSFALLVGLLILGVGSAARADIVTRTPSPADLNDLDHTQYCSWGFTYALPTDQSYVDVTLKIKGINNWQNETNHLYIHLLDSPQSGVHFWTDNQGGGDNWAGAGPLVATYIDYDAAHAVDLSYSLKSLGLLDEFAAYAATGRVGFGFDPDCHYYNSGVSLNIETQTPGVPEPASLVLMGLGLGVLRLVRRRRK